MHGATNTWNSQTNTYINIKKKKKKETRKISNNLTYDLKGLEKEEQTKPKVSGRKKIIKIREEIEIKKTQQISKTKSCLFLKR